MLSAASSGALMKVVFKLEKYAFQKYYVTHRGGGSDKHGCSRVVVSARSLRS